MTGTFVKDVGSLLNFVGNQGAVTPAVKAGNASGFGDVMNKASYSDKDLTAQNKSGNEKPQSLSSDRVNKSHPHKDALQTRESRETTKTETAADSEQAVKEAGEEMIREVAEEFDVSEEEVVKVMEEMGLSLTSLFDTENLTKLALALAGEESSLALLTDEGLYGKVQNLLQSFEEIQTGLMEDLSLNPEEFAGMMEELNARELTEEKPVILEAAKADENVKEQGKVTVTVEEGTQTVKLAVDENGNTTSVEEVRPKEDSEQNSSEKQEKGSSEKGSENQGLESANPFVNPLNQNQPQNVEVNFEQMAMSNAPDTEEIMNQILDHMKIQLRPGIEQLEMQLHPASLGMVHVQLVSRGGEVTAQFQVQNEAVKAAIENQLTILKDNLKDAGVKVEAVEVTVKSHAFESNLWQGQEREDSSAYQNSKKAPRRINLNALDEDFEEEADEEEILAAEMLRVNGGTVDYTA